LKLAFLINMLMYSVFSFAIMNYVGAVANIVTAVTTGVFLIRGKGQEPVEPAAEGTERAGTASEDGGASNE
jgi:hypothetical protein